LLQIFWGSLTVKEHIQIWRKLRNAASGIISNDDEDVIVECDLTEKARAVANTLSGGQKRKLQLAMAFAGGSKMVCIDEASSGLVGAAGM
jgi:ABC-type multidrug transport system ATPase subunit